MFVVVHEAGKLWPESIGGTSVVWVATLVTPKSPGDVGGGGVLKDSPGGEAALIVAHY